MSFRLQWPVATSTLITQYMMDRPDVYRRFGLPGHDGIDFGSRVGDDIFAAADGVVVASRVDTTGFGEMIRLLHEFEGQTFETLYAHLNVRLVTVGTRVSKGQLIAESGNTGFSDGPHLHFGLFLKGATRAGFSDYEGFGRTGTFPRDQIDPSPWLNPPLTMTPVRPLNADHPSFSIVDDSGSGMPVGDGSIQVEVNVQGLKVRQDPSTNNPPLAALDKGTQLTVDNIDFVVGAITWRQIELPIEYKNRWIAARLGDTQYLIPTASSEPADETQTEIHMIVNNDDVKLWRAANTRDAFIERLPRGTRLTVRKQNFVNGIITWRKVTAPARFEGRWVPISQGNTRLLVPSPVGPRIEVDPDASPRAGGVIDNVPPANRSVQPTPDAVGMVVTNSGTRLLKIRTEPDTRSGRVVDRVPDGTVLWVTAEEQPGGSITWRQIIAPDEFRDLWVGQNFLDIQYLLPAPPELLEPITD